MHAGPHACACACLALEVSSARHLSDQETSQSENKINKAEAIFFPPTPVIYLPSPPVTWYGIVCQTALMTDLMGLEFPMYDLFDYLRERSFSN